MWVCVNSQLHTYHRPTLPNLDRPLCCDGSDPVSTSQLSALEIREAKESRGEREKRRDESRGKDRIGEGPCQTREFDS